MSKKTGWEYAGDVWVDSGSVMVGDPCYTHGADASHAVATWHDFLERTWPATWGKNKEGQNVNDPVSKALSDPGIGIVVHSGFGDGSYPVYVKYSDEGSMGKRVAELKVVFIDDEGHHPYDEDWSPEDED